MICEDGSEIIVIHYLYRSPKGTIDSEGEPLPGVPPEMTLKIACTPNMTKLSANEVRNFPVMRTEEMGAVTCPLCKDSVFFKRSIEQQAAMRRIRSVKA